MRLTQTAKKKKIDQPVLDYANMLHTEHGQNIDQTLKLGQQVGTAPQVTTNVDNFSKRQAAQLADLVPLDGRDFERAYIAAMIKGHGEALAMIDNQFLKSAQNDQLKQHLADTRQHVAAHLEKARELQNSMGR
jgi:putative membrane protein